jgi:hypothetical protein
MASGGMNGKRDSAGGDQGPSRSDVRGKRGVATPPLEKLRWLCITQRLRTRARARAGLEKTGTAYGNNQAVERAAREIGPASETAPNFQDFLSDGREKPAPGGHVRGGLLPSLRHGGAMVQGGQGSGQSGRGCHAVPSPPTLFAFRYWRPACLPAKQRRGARGSRCVHWRVRGLG